MPDCLCGGAERVQDSRRGEDQPLLSTRLPQPTSQGSLPSSALPDAQLPENRQVPSASVSLQLSGSSEVDTVDTPEFYYVIIGCGPAAVINHSTLRKSAWGMQRIAKLPVMHIGYANPWSKYIQHGMGQPPYLLSLPGLSNQPSQGSVIDGGLNSKDFGQCIDDELELLKKQPKVTVKEGWVAWIQSEANLALPGEKLDEEIYSGAEGLQDRLVELSKQPYPKSLKGIAPYRLLVVTDPGNEQCELVYAAYIDVCTGAGRPNVFPPKNRDTDECKLARTPPWWTPENWPDNPWQIRKVLNAVDAIRDEVTWQQKERVCVTAGGGVGLNAAEKARNHSAWLDWFGRKGLMETFANPRNDTFLKHPNENRVLEPGERGKLGLDTEEQLMPPLGNLRFGLGATLADTNSTFPTVEVTLAPNGKPALRDYFGETSALQNDEYWASSDPYMNDMNNGGGPKPSKTYDRLVIPNGQGSQSVGQPHFFAGHLNPNTPLTAPDGRMIGLATADPPFHRIRLLGAAAQTYPGFALAATYVVGSDPTPKGGMWDFRAILPVSAVPDGFILSGVNIATANRFFFDYPNLNVNTMTGEELEKVVGRDLAIDIVKNRSPNNGYRDLEELKRVINSDDGRLAGLIFGYD